MLTMKSLLLFMTAWLPLAALAQRNPDYILDFSAPRRVVGAPGERIRFQAFARLSAAAGPVAGWSIGMTPTDTNLYSIVAATPVNTVSALTSDYPPGLVSGFRDIQLTTQSGPGGAVMAVILSWDTQVTLDPLAVPYRLLQITVEGPAPPRGTERICRLAFVDGLQGAGQPVPNVLTVDRRSVYPILGVHDVTFSSDFTGHSLFNNNAEDWVVVSFPNAGPYVNPAAAPVAPMYQGTGGNPGGYISTVNSVFGTHFFQAPASFLGDKSGFYGGRLWFNTKVSAGTTVSLPDVVLVSSNGLALTIDAGPEPTETWRTYSVGLTETSGWRKGTLVGSPASRVDMEKVLSSLAALRIRSEYVNGSGSGSLDNVMLEGLPRAGIRCSEVEICWNSRIGQTYRVQYRSALTGNNWLNLGDVVQANAPTTCITDKVPNGEPQRFYRTSAQP
jgi:hypothetical protein